MRTCPVLEPGITNFEACFRILPMRPREYSHTENMFPFSSCGPPWRGTPAAPGGFDVARAREIVMRGMALTGLALIALALAAMMAAQALAAAPHSAAANTATVNSYTPFLHPGPGRSRPRRGHQGRLHARSDRSGAGRKLLLQCGPKRPDLSGDGHARREILCRGRHLRRIVNARIAKYDRTLKTGRDRGLTSRPSLKAGLDCVAAATKSLA